MGQTDVQPLPDRSWAARLVPFAGLTLIAAAGFLLSGHGSAAGVSLILTFALLALAAAWSQRFAGLAFTLWLVAFASSALFFPGLYTWSYHSFRPDRLIFPLVQVIMFGMGVTLTVDDFRRVLKMPKGVLIGVSLQYLIMPLMGLIFARTFGLQSDVAAGLILIGSCPGGVASNVIAYIARANVPLSVTLTTCSTMLAPLLTPTAMTLLAGQYVPVDGRAMLVSILLMIIAPVLLGVLANRFLPRVVVYLSRVLPMVAMFGICLIIAITIALARTELLAVGVTLFGAAACHNAAGFLLGYVFSRALGLDRCDSRTVALEVGIQNGGMATGLALNVLHSPAAALASAVFGPWSAVASSILASFWRRRD